MVEAGDPRRDPPAFLALRLPVIVLVLAFTAIPAELRRPGRASLADAVNLQIDVPDIAANIAGYVPVGIVLASMGAGPAVGIAAAISVLAETTQIVSKGRSPSVIDVATNVIGAVVGLILSVRGRARWRARPPEIRVGRRTVAVAAVLAVAYVYLGVRATPLGLEQAVRTFAAQPRLAWLPVSARGDTAPGRLEAHWTFDESENGVIPDASGNGLNGVLVNRPGLAAGIDGRALRLNGVNQYADFGDPVALRLAGSLTISAWINSSAFPVDDAAIVSDLGRRGYQLDTTVDQGQRTIGFKLTDTSGRLMARYGNTPLQIGRWYHVAGVYDAQARTLNVYLDGRPDNGCLLGTVSGRQRVSEVNAYVGRRGRIRGFEFAGRIDDVRIYSRALAPDEIETEQNAASVSDVSARSFDPRTPDRLCPSSSEGADGRDAGVLVAFGMVVSVVCVGLWPNSAYRTPCLLSSFASGFLLLPLVASTLPAYYGWILPLLTLAGGAATAVSVRT